MGTALRRQATIIELEGGRKITSNGLFNAELVSQFLIQQKADRWVSIQEVTRFAKHSATPTNQKHVRKQLRKLVLHLRAQGRVLLIDYGSHGKAEFVKIYRGKTEEEKQHANFILGKMSTHKDAKADEIDQMRILVAATDAAVAEQETAA